MTKKTRPDSTTRTTDPTILDVARKAGVSVGTVSNVMNGTSKVSHRRRELVLEAIASLGYVTNVMAQGLRRRHSNVIGLCVPNASAAYFSILSENFEAIAQTQGLEMIHVFSHLDGETELRRLRTLLNFKPAGLLLFPSTNPKPTLDFIHKSGVPTVILDRPLDDPRFDQVSVDARKAADATVQGLINRGHRSLLFLLKERSLLVNRHRIEGIRRAIRRSPVLIDLQIIARKDNPDEAMAQLRDALDGHNPPTAIIASNSSGAAWTVKALHALGLACPKDMSLIAADEPDWAELVKPTLSVVRPPTDQLTEEAWRLLAARMAGDFSEPVRVRLDAEVHFAGSVGEAPARPGRASHGLPARAVKRRRTTTST